MKKLETLLNTLPHGSGIDYDWTIEEKKGKIICHNAWHYMNEQGFYDGILPFRIVITKDDINLHFEGLNGDGWYRVRKGYIRQYLEDLFWTWFETHMEV